MTLGDNVRWRRKVEGLTQAQLASRIRVNHRIPTPSLISKIESGKLDPRLSTIRSIARALHVKPWVLVADLMDNWTFWGDYLSLKPPRKRDVQRYIENLTRRGIR